MENLNLQHPLTPNGTHDATPGPVIDLPAASVTALPVHAPPMVPTVTPHTWADAACRAMDAGGSLLGFLWKLCKLLVCIGLDIFDFTVGRLLGFGIAVDIGSGLIAAALWGRWWGLWEILDITEQLDGFIPTCTLIALTSWND